MKVAVEGCCHGQLDAIYTAIASLEARNNYKVDLLLICGDFQAIRNESDLLCMSVPDKYKELGEFWKYYTGEKVAPILTIIIGGNHEASNYFWELFHGGWIAPNMYFLGHAGCVRANGVRIAGASGIWGEHDFERGFWERVPYNNSTMRSIYHIREYNIRRLSLLTPAPTIFLSHDWPHSIAHHGDLPRLLRAKPFFRRDIETGKLGSPPMWGLMNTLRPGWWFSAHLHVRFEARVRWEEGEMGQNEETAGAQVSPVKNPDEIEIDLDDEDDGGVEPQSAAAAANPDEILIEEDDEPQVPATIQQPVPPSVNPEEIAIDDLDDANAALPSTDPRVLPSDPESPPTKKEWGEGKGWPETRFLSLDKCLPRRQFLEVVDIPTPTTPSAPSTPVLTFDTEWLGITRAFNAYMTTARNQSRYPDEADARAAVATAMDWVRANVPGADDGEGKRVDEVQMFVTTAPGPAKEGGKGARTQPKHHPNQQTAAFCAMLGIENKIDH